MRSRKRRLALWVAAFAALFAAAGTATAVVEERIFEVGAHETANLAGTRVLCQAATDRDLGAPAFVCAAYSPRGIPLKGSYAVKVSEHGVSLDKIVSAAGENQPVRRFRNVRDRVFEVQTGEVAQLAGAAFGCGSQLTNGVRTFGCVAGVPGSGAARPRTYGVLINERGVSVLRIDANGRTVTRIGEWRNA